MTKPLITIQNVYKNTRNGGVKPVQKYVVYRFYFLQFDQEFSTKKPLWGTTSSKTQKNICEVKPVQKHIVYRF